MKPYALYTIIAINIAMFIATVVIGGEVMHPPSGVLYALGANTIDTLHGEPWRLITAMFLHGGLIHIAMNMLCLYQGRVLVPYYGSLGFVVLYLVAGLVGGIASLIGVDSSHLSIGASGAVFGVFGALFVVIYQRRHELGPELTKSQLLSLGQFFGLNFVLAFFIPGIDHKAHVGGLLGGAACAWFMRSQRDPDAKRRLTAVGGAGVSLTALAVLLMR